MLIIFAAIVNVISLKWVQHKTKPKKITTCIIKNRNEPLFHEFSCLLPNENKNNFLIKCKTNNKKIKSTPRSCSQKKSSIKILSESSSSREDGINIGSLINENDNKIPEIHWTIIINNKNIPNMLILFVL